MVAVEKNVFAFEVVTKDNITDSWPAYDPENDPYIIPEELHFALAPKGNNAIISMRKGKFIQTGEEDTQTFTYTPEELPGKFIRIKAYNIKPQQMKFSGMVM